MMMNKLLTVSTMLAAEAQDLGGAFSPERWKYALQMTLMGMGTIFAVLTLLLLVLLLFKVVFARGSGSKKEKEIHKADSVPATPAPVSAPVVAPTVQDDEVTVAVITAAIAAYRASEDPSGASVGGFRVVSFRRADNGRAWNSRK